MMPRPSADRQTIDRVVVPVIGRADELDLQRRAVDLAANHDARVLAVHVRDHTPAVPVDLFRYLASTCARREVPFDADLVEESTDAPSLGLGAGDLLVGPDPSAEGGSHASQADRLIGDVEDMVRDQSLG